ncbi:MAG: PEP-CTERM sorting domain-containing protein [Planctomycetes bacterium]|nr:PEP-CTERM sorting domain-containing protein [Planctomycetota bacterium]
MAVVVLVTLTSDGLVGRADQVLLATRAVRGTSGASQIIDTPQWPVLYYRDDTDFLDRTIIFEDFVLEGDYPVTIHNTVSSVNDPDFDRFADFLTDGISQLMWTGAWTANNRWGFAGGSGGPEPLILDARVPLFGPDLIGYEIDYIVQNLTVNLESPGRDFNDNGVWTDFHVDGVYEFWGSPIPEPATLLLLALGSVALLRRRA